MFRFTKLLLALAIALPLVALGSRYDIRFYKVNKKGQQTYLRFIFNEDEPGCHNLPTIRDIHRVAIVGYRHCTLFSKKDCPTGKEVSARWKDRGQALAQLTQGTRWFISREKNSQKVGSWDCEMKSGAP